MRILKGLFRSHVIQTVWQTRCLPASGTCVVFIDFFWGRSRESWPRSRLKRQTCCLSRADKQIFFGGDCGSGGVCFSGSSPHNRAHVAVPRFFEFPPLSQHHLGRKMSHTLGPYLEGDIASALLRVAFCCVKFTVATSNSNSPDCKFTFPFADCKTNANSHWNRKSNSVWPVLHSFVMTVLHNGPCSLCVGPSSRVHSVISRNVSARVLSL